MTKIKTTTQRLAPPMSEDTDDVSGSRNGVTFGDSLAIAALLAIVLSAHLAIQGPVPSGGDAGNWLAVAKEWLGQSVMASDVSYLPIFPSLLSAILLLLQSSVHSVLIVGLLAKATLITAFYICARPLGIWYAIAAGLLLGMAGAQLEAFAWGGYAQLLGMAFGLSAVFSAVRYIQTGRPPHLLVSASSVAAALLTHALIGGLVGVAILAATAQWLYIAENRRRYGSTSIRVALGLAVPSILVVAGSQILSQSNGVEPVLNPLRLGYGDAAWSALRDAPAPWILLTLLALSVIFRRGWRPRVAATVATGSGWAVAGLAFFLYSGEARSLLVSQTGVVLLAIAGFAASLTFMWHSPRARHTDRGRLEPVLGRLTLILGVSLGAGIIAGGLSAYSAATDWYRLVDESELRALDRLATSSQPGDLVLSASGHNGNPVGWWVQGYAEIPSYTAISPNFVAFPEEREHAGIANRFFEGDLDWNESRSVLKETGADFVVVDRRGPHATWLDGEVAGQFGVVDKSSNLVILRSPSVP